MKKRTPFLVEASTMLENAISSKNTKVTKA